MLSSQGKPTDTETSNHTEVITNTVFLEEKEVKHEQVFPLIESLLSFEVCLYHQILPLKMEDNRLLLGMVNQEDDAALNYVLRILSYIKCTLVAQPINSDFHRHVLSAFLNYKNQPQSAKPREDQPEKTLTAEKTATKSVDQPVFPTTSDLEEIQHPTLVLEETLISENLPIQLNYPPNQKQADNLPQNTFEPNFLTTTHSTTEEKSENSTFGSVTVDNLHILSVPSPEEFTPGEQLLTLPPKKLLQELLGRVLGGGIGRLFLGRLPYSGKILWSENGVLQSVLEEVPLSVFQGVMNELKRFVSLPVITLTEPIQVEKECLYRQERLLLRLRIISGTHGEEATLQVLKGAALKFYQQQQLSRLSRDALSISQQLSYKLHELQDRLLLNHNISSNQLETFNALNQTLCNLEQQIKKLTM